MQTLGVGPIQRYGHLPLLAPTGRPRRVRTTHVTASLQKDNESNPLQTMGQSMIATALVFATTIGLPFHASALPDLTSAIDKAKEQASGAASEMATGKGSTGQTPEDTKIPELANKAEDKGTKVPADARASADLKGQNPAFTIAGDQGNPPAPSLAAKNAAKSVQNVVSPQPAAPSLPGGAVGGVGVLGILGAALFIGQQGSTPKDPKKAVKAGTKKVGAAAKQVQKKAPSPKGLKQQAKKPAKQAGGLFGGAKQQAKKPAKQAGNLIGGAKQQAKKPAKQAGGLLASAKRAAPSPQQAAKKIAPKASKKVSAGTRKVGAGTRKAGAKSGGILKQLDDDTSSTIAALGVVGLGVAVGAFIIFSIISGIEPADIAEEATKEVQAALPSPKRDNPAAKAASKAAPDVVDKVKQAAPSPAKAIDQVKQAAPSPAAAVDKAKAAAPSPAAAVDKAKAAAPSPAAAVDKAKDAAPNPQDAKPVDFSSLFGGGSSSTSRASDTASKAQDKASDAASQAKSAVADVAKAAPAPKEAAKEVKDVAAKTVPGVSEDVPKPSSGKTQEPVNNLAADPDIKSNPKFEAAKSNFLAGPTGAEQFKDLGEKDKLDQQNFNVQRASDIKKNKQPGNAIGNSANRGPSIGSETKGKPAPAGGSQNLIILGGLAVAVVGGLAVANPQKASDAVDKASEAANPAGQAAQGGGSSGGSSSEGSSSGGGSGGDGDVKDDIKNRKQDAQKWIKNWRDETGGKP